MLLHRIGRVLLAGLLLAPPAATLEGQGMTLVGKRVELRAQSGFRGRQIKAKGEVVELTSHELVLDGKKGRRSYPLALIHAVKEEGGRPISVGCLRPEPQPGGRVRVSVRNGWRTSGVLLEWRADTLVVEDNNGTRFAIGRSDVEKIEWPSGWEDPLIDAASGSTMGAILGAKASDGPGGALAATLGAALGLLMGPAIGESLSGWWWEDSCHGPGLVEATMKDGRTTVEQVPQF